MTGCARFLGRRCLLGLEFLVAGDIIKTVAIEPTFDSVVVLAIIVLVRTVLSLSIDVEIDGRWPWEAARQEAQRLVSPSARADGGGLDGSRSRTHCRAKARRHEHRERRCAVSGARHARYSSFRARWFATLVRLEVAIALPLRDVPAELVPLRLLGFDQALEDVVAEGVADHVAPSSRPPPRPGSTGRVGMLRRFRSSSVKW